MILNFTFIFMPFTEMTSTIDFDEIAFINKVIRDYYEFPNKNLADIFNEYYENIIGFKSDLEKQILKFYRDNVNSESNIHSESLYSFLMNKIDDYIYDHDDSDAETEDEN